MHLILTLINVYIYVNCVFQRYNLSILPYFHIFVLLLWFMSCMFCFVLTVLFLFISISLVSFLFTSKSPCLSVHYSTLWITFWWQYVTSGPPGSLPGARFVSDIIYTNALSERAPPLTRAMEQNETIRIIWPLFRTFFLARRTLRHRCQCALRAFLPNVSCRGR